MEEIPGVHFRIEVYDDAPPPAEPNATTLCPAGRVVPHGALANEVAQVTCRRCLQLLDVIGLRPIQ
jgi:hypothetical protein